MSEEDQTMTAIAISLGQDILMDQRAEAPQGNLKVKVICLKEAQLGNSNTAHSGFLASL